MNCSLVRSLLEIEKFPDADIIRVLLRITVLLGKETAYMVK